jgi:tetratricopeptide (TPR) repeat protein
MLAAACAQDLYHQRITAMKDHTRNFYTHLQADRVHAAVIENERIEAIASTAGAETLQRSHTRGSTDLDPNWELVRTAYQAAAENWLNLGRYLMHHKRYDEARAVYRRVLNVYADPLYRTYAEQAKAGLKDVDILNPRTP